MRTIGNPATLARLVARLRTITPETQRRWGTLTPHEMLCHLGDACEMVLRRRPRPNAVMHRRRPVYKALVLWSPVRWPRGFPTNPSHDPRADGTRPVAFAADQERAIAALAAIGTADPRSVEPLHGKFGTMSLRDWQRWAYKHTDHHLRQFGL